MDEIKDALKDIWRNKPLSIAIGIALAVGVYILYKRGQSTAGTADTSTTPPTQPSMGSSGTFVENSYNYAPVSTTTVTNPPPVTGGSPTPPGLPVPSQPTTRTVTVRAPSSVDIARKIKSAPLKKSVGSSSDVGRLPWGATITLTGRAVTGPYNKPLSGGNGSNQWYPATYQGVSGYVSAWDIVGG